MENCSIYLSDMTRVREQEHKEKQADKERAEKKSDTALEKKLRFIEKEFLKDECLSKALRTRILVDTMQQKQSTQDHFHGKISQILESFFR